MKLVKKYYIEILFLPIIGNFVINIFSNKKMNFLSDVNFYNLISSFFLFLILFFTGKAIKETFKLETVSIGIVFYFVYLFLIDNTLLFITKNILFDTYFFIFNFLLLFYIIISKKALKEVYYLLISFLVNFGFVTYFEKFLRVRKQLKGDVAYQWFPMAENIYNQNYFYSLTNPVIDGYGQLISYVHASLLKINLIFEDFEYLTSTTNLFFFLAILFFFELNISTKNKTYLSIVFFVLVINSDWLNYLYFDSLMGEGVVSLFFSIGLISLFKEVKKGKNSNFIIFITFGSLYFTKQFVTTLIIFIILALFFLNIKNVKILYAFIPFLINEINLKTILINTRRDPYASNFDFKDTIIDLLTNTNLKLENAVTIFLNLIEDKPYSYLLCIFLFSNLFLFSKKYFDAESLYFMIIFSINLFLILALYISAWRNMPEFDSAIRFILNLFHLTLIFSILNLDRYLKFTD